MVHFKKPNRESFRLDITPLINIVFLLLIFFMLTSSAITTSANVDLPEAQSSEQSNTQDLTLSIEKDGSLFFGKEPVQLEVLATVLEDKLAEKSKKVLTIEADKELSFDVFGKVLDEAQQVGIEDFMISTQILETTKER